MRRTCKLFVAISIALAMLSSDAFAGDDGSKRDASLRVRNNFPFAIGVIVDADEDDLMDLLDSTDPVGDFEDLGGVIINPGETDTVTGLKAGSHQVFVVDGGDFENNTTTTVNLNKGQQRTITVNEGDQGDIEIDF
jgi:hypothetical protein